MLSSAHGKALVAILLAGTVMLGTYAPASAPTHQPLTIRVSRADPEQALLAMQNAMTEQLQQDRVRELARREAEAAQRRAESRGMLASRGGGERSLVDYPVSSPSYVTAAELNAAFAGTGMAGLGEAFVNAEQQYQVNAVILAAIGVHESGWGNSGYARERHNLFGFGAYTSSPDSALRFASPQEGIATVAEWLHSQYLTPGGRYYRGGTLRAMAPIYAADEGWAYKVGEIAATISRRMGQ